MKGLAAGPMFRKGLAFLRRDFLIEASYRFSFFLQMIGILFTASVAYFFARFLRQQGLEQVAPFAQDYFSFVILGVAFLDYLGTSLNVFSRSLREGQLTGTLEPLLVTQTSPEAIVLGSAVYALAATTARLAAYLLLGVALFGMPLGAANWGAALVLLILSVAAFSSLGILSASFILLFKRGDPLTWLVMSVSVLLSGVLYPLSALPGWLAKLAWVLPLTSCLEAMRRALLGGEGLSELWRESFILALFATVGLPLALLVFRWSVRRAKITGTLAQY